MSVSSNENPRKSLDLFRVDGKGAFAFTIRTVADPKFPTCVLIERAKGGPAFYTIKLDIFQLGEHATSTCNYPRNADKVVEMGATKIAEGRCQGKIGNANVHFGMNTRIAREIHEDSTQSHLIEDFEHSSGRICQEVGQYRLR